LENEKIEGKYVLMEGKNVKRGECKLAEKIEWEPVNHIKKEHVGELMGELK